MYSIFEGERVTNSILTVTYPSLQTSICSSFDDSRKVILRMPNSMIFLAEIPWSNERWKINKEYISCLFQLHPIYGPLVPGITSHVKYPGAFLNMCSAWSFWGYLFLMRLKWGLFLSSNHESLIGSWTTKLSWGARNIA